MYGDQSIGFVLISTNIGPCFFFGGGGRGEGDLPNKSDRDACRHALGIKLQILVSLRVSGIESHNIFLFRYRLVLYIEKFTKNAMTLTTRESPLGVSLSLSHTHLGLPGLI